ncbi:hypothetical protein [Achromobacter sp. RTa]|uniref:hypothetical protein n=1 Tax=Achromobacter sp. RTa TaxID=1532557 RepID=UPI0012E0332E|nr:hypothetical protein [Achromobacter sp. RTa]
MASPWLILSGACSVAASVALKAAGASSAMACCPARSRSRPRAWRAAFIAIGVFLLSK